ncbi:hypothetical protein [uncultured Jatrophihabitans sp.]|uniref:hypothetical protein n=1 Tax=uncultured Jatrophihabitans sp. TaxID=1610747 RepID=UPI0035CA8F98
MTIKTPPRSALRIPYLAVRTPLGLLDEQVVVRVFGVDSTAHRSLLRGLQTLDALAASAFATTSGASAPPEADAQTDTLAEDTEDGDTAADDTAADDTAAEADIITDVQPVERDGGEQPIEPAEQEEIEQLAETFLAEDDLAPRSGELAENDELRRVQAEIRAKQAIETQHGQL